MKGCIIKIHGIANRDEDAERTVYIYNIHFHFTIKIQFEFNDEFVWWIASLSLAHKHPHVSSASFIVRAIFFSSSPASHQPIQ